MEGWSSYITLISYFSTLPPNAILIRIPPGPLLTAHQSETTADLLKVCVFQAVVSKYIFWSIRLLIRNQDNGKKQTKKQCWLECSFFIFMNHLWSLASKSNSIEYLPTAKMSKKAGILLNKTSPWIPECIYTFNYFQKQF